MITILERKNVGNNMQLYIIFVHFVGRCVTITKYQCQLSPENNNNGDGLSDGAIAGIVIGFVVVILFIIAIIFLKIFKVKYSQYLKHYLLLLTSVHACSDY